MAAQEDNPYNITRKLEDAYFMYPNEERPHLLAQILEHPELPRFIREHTANNSYAVRFLVGTFTVHNTVEHWRTLRDSIAFIEEIGFDKPELSEEDVTALVRVIKDVLLKPQQRAKSSAKNLVSLLKTSREHSASLYHHTQSHGATLMGKYIPPDALGKISSFLTGEKGTASTQLKKLREKSSRLHGAPGAHGGTRRGRSRRGIKKGPQSRKR
jgi:hypothetical protein